jgi:superfamily II DNA or RNA helicase
LPKFGAAVVSKLRQINKKALLLAHREELISQADEKFRLFRPNASLGICMAERFL